MMKLIKLVMGNWKATIELCTHYIDKGIEVEFYTQCRERAAKGFDESSKMYFKELAKMGTESKFAMPKPVEETENGSYDTDEESRRFDEQVELHSIDLIND